MRKIKIASMLTNLLATSKPYNIALFMGIAVFFTLLISGKYFLFQNVIDSDGSSKKDIYASKNIEVVDTFKTEQQKKEITLKIEPILVPAEDGYIKTNLNTLTETIKILRQKNIPTNLKEDEIATLFDFPDANIKSTVTHYLINASDRNIENVFIATKESLNNVLKQGVSEKDFEKQNLERIIRHYSDSSLTRNQVKVLVSLIEQVIIPNMMIDERATEIARKNAVNSITPYKVIFRNGDKIVSKGEPVTRLKRDALSKAGYNVLELNFPGIIGIFCLVSIGIISLVYYIQYFEKKYFTKDYLLLIGLLATIVSVIAVTLPDDVSIYLLPFPAFAIIVSIFTKPRIAFTSTIILITIIALSLQIQTQAIAVFIVVTLIATISTVKIRYSRRFDLVKTGVEVAMGMVLIILSTYLIEKCIMDVDNSLVISDILAGFTNGMISGMIALALIPLIESIFKIITPYGLAELADHNQPLLKRLQFEAPGTFSHCLMVSNLCEAAAEAIGADPILARVGAFYHDIGKLKRPLFFVENQTYFGIENPHTKLNPRLSKMVITAHPKDGMEIAKEYGIPPVIQNFIIQHHGESLAMYFYNEAIKQEGVENVTEEQFRYAGVKPNTKETAILMLADAVESASRTLTEHSQEELEKLCDKLILDRLNDGQLSDSPLTLKDLKTITQAFVRTLRATHHQRIKYHENIVKELENKIYSNKLLISNTGKVCDTELEEKIEKKIQKRQQKVNGNNGSTKDNKDKDDEKS